MGRNLFFLVLGVLIYAAIVMARSKRVRNEERSQVSQSRGRSTDSVAMVECPQCHTFFPKGEAVLGDGIAYCSERCRNAARGQR